MNESQQSRFEGFAILEIFGHQKYAGFVKTEYYGTACMFRCDIPPLPERESVTKGGCYVEGPNFKNQFAPPGSTVKQPATEAYSKLFGVGAIYSMTPCDEKACLAAVAELQPRPLMLVKLPKGKVLAASSEYDETEIRTPCPMCGLPEYQCQCQDDDSPELGAKREERA
jgi:hypothetical protein